MIIYIYYILYNVHVMLYKCTVLSHLLVCTVAIVCVH